jgi:PTS system N-acetylgalactosamine-specific IIA component
MTKVIVIGHGSYGSMIEESLKMLVGSPDGFSFLDFDIHDDLTVLKNKLHDAVSFNEGSPILFACDLTGGSPFREASILAMENREYAVVGGLNTAGFTEMVYNLELPPIELAKLAVEASKESMMIFNTDTENPS